MGAFGGGGMGAGPGDGMFDSFFGGGGGPEFGGGQDYARQGVSKKAQISISFEDAAKGIEKEIAVTTNIECSKCNGSGANSPQDIKTCTTCHGSGHLHQSEAFSVCHMPTLPWIGKNDCCSL